MNSTTDTKALPPVRRGWVPPLECALTPRYSPDEQAWPAGYSRRVWLRADDRRAARRAREFAAAACGDWGLLPLLDSVASCVSELATNALVHVRWETVAPPRLFAVDLRLFGTQLTVEVADPDPSLPTIPDVVLPQLPGDVSSDALSVHGWGLHTVAALVRESGGSAGVRRLDVDGLIAGKVVWAWFLTERHPRDG
jgi:hypothetical protein